MFKVFLFVVGVFLIGVTVLRMVHKRLSGPNTYKAYIERVKLRWPDNKNEFGQNVKWSIRERARPDIAEPESPPEGSGGA